MAKTKNFTEWQKRGWEVVRSEAYRQQAIRGELSTNWKGGITPVVIKIRNCSRYMEWRNACYKRDKYTCQSCGDAKGNNLVAHHKIPFAQLIKELSYIVLPDEDLYTIAMKYDPLFNIDNGITYCYDCHMAEHKRVNADIKKRINKK